MKYKLVFARTVCDPLNAWTQVESVIVEVPDELSNENSGGFPWHLVGGSESEVQDE